MSRFFNYGIIQLLPFEVVDVLEFSCPIQYLHSISVLKVFLFCLKNIMRGIKKPYRLQISCLSVCLSISIVQVDLETSLVKLLSPSDRPCLVPRTACYEYQQMVVDAINVSCAFGTPTPYLELARECSFNQYTAITPPNRYIKHVLFSSTVDASRVT